MIPTNHFSVVESFGNFDKANRVTCINYVLYKLVTKWHSFIYYLVTNSYVFTKMDIFYTNCLFLFLVPWFYPNFQAGFYLCLFQDTKQSSFEHFVPSISWSFKIILQIYGPLKKCFHRQRSEMNTICMLWCWRRYQCSCFNVVLYCTVS